MWQIGVILAILAGDFEADVLKVGLEPTFCFRLMIKQNKKMIELLSPVVSAMGFELLGIEQLNAGKYTTLRVYIDHDKGINLDDCAKVSHQLAGVLDVNDPIKTAYQLEVSSPGINRPLFSLEHFKRFSDHKVKLSLSSKIDGRRNITGVIDDVTEDSVILGDGDEEIEIPVKIIDRAHLIEL